eukprot:m.9089 g.9089  ORF g.9089 m.9089 type:complete len:340 (-) comp4007_c0_seq1:2034-3053(-)
MTVGVEEVYGPVTVDGHESVAMPNALSELESVYLVGNVSSNNSTCMFKCPTLMDYPVSWQLWILVVSYFFIAIASMILARKHKQKLSFRHMFLYLQSFLCVLRTVIFTVRFKGEEEHMFPTLLVTETLPIFIQFVIFSLLIVFLIKVLLAMQEKSHLTYRLLYPGYVVLIAILGVTSVLFAYITNKKRNEDKFDGEEAYYGAIAFGVLSLCISVTGWKTHRTLMKIVLSEARQRQIVGVSYVVAMYSFVFLLRTVWNATSIFDQNWFQNKLYEYQQLHMQEDYYIGLLIFYMVFEVMPMIFLLRCFWVWLRPRPETASRYNSHSRMGSRGMDEPLLQTT